MRSLKALLTENRKRSGVENRREEYPIGLLVNIFLRLSILYFLGEVLLFPNDPRFAGKAIPVRNFIIVLTLSALLPLFYFWRKRWARYPFWIDNLYLSLFWLDMAGNSFNLYDGYFYFDLIPHFHGTGAIAAVLKSGFGLLWLSAVGGSNLIHTALEAQEYYTDVLFGTHNVRGTFDVVNDLVVGMAGSMIYAAGAIVIERMGKTGVARGRVSGVKERYLSPFRP